MRGKVIVIICDAIIVGRPAFCDFFILRIPDTPKGTLEGGSGGYHSFGQGGPNHRRES